MNSGPFILLSIVVRLGTYSSATRAPKVTSQIRPNRECFGLMVKLTVIVIGAIMVISSAGFSGTAARASG